MGTSFLEADEYEYLLSLGMKVDIKSFGQVYIARIAQLSNKSNQFNLTTRRYTQAEVEAAAGKGRMKLKWKAAPAVRGSRQR